MRRLSSEQDGGNFGPRIIIIYDLTLSQADYPMAVQLSFESCTAIG